MVSEIIPLHTPKLDRNALVVRHNDLIESRHRLTVPERRFMLWQMSQIKKDDEEFKTYRIGVNEFAEFSGLEPNARIYRDVSAIADSLSLRTLVIKDEQAKEDTYTPWFLKIKYKWGEGYVESCLNPEIKKLLLQLKESYTAITLEYALLLKSSYSGRIYDLLKQYEKIGERIIRIDDLRDMLDLGTKYAKYPDFRRYVIEVAQKEINEKTDISYNWEAIKEGRKFASIKFTIWKEAPPISLDNREESQYKAQKLYKILCSLGIAEKAARSLIASYDDERIEWHINEYNMLKTKGKVNSTGWLVKAIRADYRPKNLLDILDEKKDDTAPQETEQKPLKITDLLKPETVQETRKIAKFGFLDWVSVKKAYCEKINEYGKPDELDKDFIAFFKDKVK
jgi:plasmid replication initiation protein